jgi:hypothetical protein
MPDITNEHLVKESSTFAEYYPAHPPRTESSLFRKTKKHYHDTGATCLICGSKDKIEIHHFFCEWAFADAVDWEHMKTIHPDFDWSIFQSPTDFVDSIYNTIPLCEVHHRDPHKGIHHIPYPNWIIQKYVKTDFVLFPDDIK